MTGIPCQSGRGVPDGSGIVAVALGDGRGVPVLLGDGVNVPESGAAGSVPEGV